MTPERWQQIKGVLDQSLDLNPGARTAFLEQVCSGDLSLRHEVEQLLAAEKKAGPEFLNTSAISLSLAEGFTPKTDTWIGRRIGSYQIVEQIGSGGMGEVYRAFRADDQYKKEVAIKLVRAGPDSDFVLSRFKNERQLLAGLDHPDIARLLDGGTTSDGVPYFVMELIEGQSITEYCDNHKLSVTQRLKLFFRACQAVQYAHQRLIIHRDLKPSNILVDTGGAPKLLDFGIAKLLDPAADSAESTVSMFRMLTPSYASPEQIKGEALTTASDVYSLGVLLYELLTGHHPYPRSRHAAHEIAQAVCTFEPEKPSTAIRRTEKREPVDSLPEITPQSVSAVREGSPEKLSKRLRGDLDNILLMALRKEPQRRYASAEQFAEDIRRHLENLPVIARHDTVSYLTSKFVARHKAGVIAATAVAVTVFAGLAVTLHEDRIARMQQARAEHRFNDVRKLANSLMFEVHDSIKDLPGSTAARRLLVTRALEYLDSLSREASGDPSLQRELAAAYDRVGDVLGYNGAANLGDFAGASQSYTKALAIREALAAANLADPNLQGELADEYFRVAIALENTGDFPGALNILQRLVPLAKKSSPSPNDPKLQYRMAGVYYYSALALEWMGDFSGALQNYRQAASTLEPLAAEPQANVFLRAHVAAHYCGMAKMLARTGQIDEAITMSSKAVLTLQQLATANPTNATLREYLAESYQTSVDLFQKKGDLREALERGRLAHQIYGELKAADPSNQLAAQNFVFSDLQIGEIQVLHGKIAEGGQHIREAQANLSATAGPKSLWDAIVLSQSYSDLAMTYTALAQRSVADAEKARYWREARSSYEKGLKAWDERPNLAISNAFGSDPALNPNREITKCDANLQELEANAAEPRHTPAPTSPAHPATPANTETTAEQTHRR